MKVVIIGGHLTPALSVIDELPKEVDVLYIGRKHALEGDKSLSFEYETIKSLGIPFKNLTTGRLQRSFTIYTIPSLLKIPFGYLSSVMILKKFKPKVMVGFGGYLSLPVALAAKTLKIPIVIHEQTFGVGLSNKYIAKFAEKICISFDSSKKFFPQEKTVLTGNPVRKSVKSPKKSNKFKDLKNVIYITGGSLGASQINKLVMEVLPKLLEGHMVIHQTGRANNSSDFNKLTILKEGLNKDKKNKYFLSKNFSLDEVGLIYSISDLIVGRAGINTVSELINIEKPALLIPLLSSQRNEQLENAKYFKKIGLGEYLDKNEATGDIFLEKVNHMFKNLSKYKLKKEFKEIGSSAKRIVKVIYEAANKSSY